MTCPAEPGVLTPRLIRVVWQTWHCGGLPLRAAGDKPVDSRAVLNVRFTSGTRQHVKEEWVGGVLVPTVQQGTSVQGTERKGEGSVRTLLYCMLVTVEQVTDVEGPVRKGNKVLGVLCWVHSNDNLSVKPVMKILSKWQCLKPSRLPLVEGVKLLLYMFVVNFDALAQASDFQIEGR